MVISLSCFSIAQNQSLAGENIPTVFLMNLTVLGFRSSIECVLFHLFFLWNDYVIIPVPGVLFSHQSHEDDRSILITLSSPATSAMSHSHSSTCLGVSSLFAAPLFKSPVTAASWTPSVLPCEGIWAQPCNTALPWSAALRYRLFRWDVLSNGELSLVLTGPQ